MEVHAKLLNLKIYPKSKHLFSICPHGNQERALTENKILGCKGTRTQGGRNTYKEKFHTGKKKQTAYQEAKIAGYKDTKLKRESTPNIFEPYLI